MSCCHPTQYEGIYLHAPGLCPGETYSPILLSPSSSSEDTLPYTPPTPPPSLNCEEELPPSPTLAERFEATIKEEEDWSKKYYVAKYKICGAGFATADYIRRIKNLVSHLDIEYVACYTMANGTECYSFKGDCPVCSPFPDVVRHSENKFEYKVYRDKKYAGWKCFKLDMFKNDFYLQ